MEKDEENENDFNEIFKVASQQTLTQFLQDHGLSVLDPIFTQLREQMALDLSLNSLKALSVDQLL